MSRGGYLVGEGPVGTRPLFLGAPTRTVGTLLAVGLSGMAIIQALLALITRSAGKILNAIFGWAVHALFGKTTSRDQTMLSALVAAAAAWPLLVAGIIAPKVAAFVLAFVPLPHAVPSWVVRIVWSTLALAVPVALGLTLAARGPKKMRADPVWKRILRGFPLTLGLAAAFMVMFVTVPILRLISMVRRETSADIPLITDVDAYHQVAGQVVESLNSHGFDLKAAEPGWWVKAPTRILSALGGQAFAGFVPQRIEYYVAPGLSISFYTSGILLRGKGPKLTWAHGLIVEVSANSDGLQTFAPKAQEMERQIHDVWRTFEAAPAAHPRTGDLLGAVDDLAGALGRLDVPYDDWQSVYRQLLQLDRAVHGDRQLLDDVGSTDKARTTNNHPNKEVPTMSSATMPKNDAKPRPTSLASRAPTPLSRPTGTPPTGSPAALSTAQLVGEISRETQELMKTQVELVKAELRADLSRELAMVKGFGAAALAALVGLNLLMVGGVLALARTMPAWQAALLATALFWLFAAGAAGYAWHVRVHKPLQKSRRAIDEDVRWMKERLT